MTVAEGQAWRSFVLGEFLRVKHGYAFKGEHFSDSGPYIVLTPGNFYDEGGFKHKENEKYYTGDFPSDFLLKRGDLLVVMTEQKVGLLGSPAIVPEADVYLHNQRLGLIVDLDADLAHRKFLYYLFNFRGVREQIQATANGAKVRHTSPSRIYEVEVRLPSLEAQCMIASILSAYDDLIANNLRRIKILEEMAQALFREWFVKFRFPGHERVRMVESSLGKVPEGWGPKSLGEICAKITDGAHSSPKSVEDGLPMASVKDLTPFGINLESCRHIASGDFETLVRQGCQPNVGDVLIAKDGASALDTVCLLEEKLEIVLLSSVAILRPDVTKVLPILLRHYLDDDATRAYMKSSFTTGAAIPRVILKDFARALVVVPPVNLQQRFNHLARAAADQTQALIKKNRVLRRTRDLLLPKLISGDLDVSNLDIPIPEDAA